MDFSVDGGSDMPMQIQIERQIPHFHPNVLLA
jgi:hypothetical protein